MLHCLMHILLCLMHKCQLKCTLRVFSRTQVLSEPVIFEQETGNSVGYCHEQAVVNHEPQSRPELNSRTMGAYHSSAHMSCLTAQLACRLHTLDSHIQTPTICLGCMFMFYPSCPGAGLSFTIATKHLTTNIQKNPTR